MGSYRKSQTSSFCFGAGGFIEFGAVPSSDTNTSDANFQADIPPAFGGFYSNCFAMDQMHWQRIKQTTVLGIKQVTKQVAKRAMKIVSNDVPKQVMEQAINQHMRASNEAINLTIGLANKKVTCRCTSQSPGHLDKDEVEKFLTSMSQYDVNRRIFDTDNSLGLGPMKVEDEDEVWTLEGATIPFILRPVDDHYKLFGACYIHRASEVACWCSICSEETARDQIMLSEIKQSAVPGTSIGTRSSWDALLCSAPAISGPSQGPFENRASTLSGSPAEIKIR